jgi:hypothetical protein
MIISRIRSIVHFLAGIILNKRNWLQIYIYHKRNKKVVLKINFGYFTNNQTVQNKIRNYKVPEEFSILYFAHKSYNNRFNKTDYKTNYYNAKNKLLFHEDSIMITPFFGRDKKTLLYREKDKVLFNYFGTILKGYISKTPPDKQAVLKINRYKKDQTCNKAILNQIIKSRGGSFLDMSDDCYLITFGNNNHSHIHEHDILEKIHSKKPLR